MSNETENTLTFTDANFEKDVLQSNLPVLVDFSAEWCAPCQLVSTTMDTLSARFIDRVKVGKLDIDSNSLPGTLGIRSIPTVILFHEGNIEKQWIGLQSIGDYEEGLLDLLGQVEVTD